MGDMINIMATWVTGRKSDMWGEGGFLAIGIKNVEICAGFKRTWLRHW